MRVELHTPDAWVDMHGVDDLRNKHQRQMQKEFIKLGAGASDATVQTDYVYAPDRILAVCITDWYIPYLPDAVIPKNQPPGEDSNLGELKIADSRILELEAEKVRRAVFPTDSTEPEVKDGEVDPESPTLPASELKPE